MGPVEQVKALTWFYEFELPDGSKTQADYPNEILKIHTSRRDALRRVINTRVEKPFDSSAADLSSHEGYFSFELASKFSNVDGYEFRSGSIDRARLMQSALSVENVTFSQFDIQKADPEQVKCYDFVLLYGLLYHMENPVHSLRVACAMTRKHVLIDTQIFPYDLVGRIEDSAYMHLRPVEGMFALAPDYSNHREGGSTDYSLVPSLNALQYLLKQFGFQRIEVIPPHNDYYEQFLRGRRVILYASR